MVSGRFLMATKSLLVDPAAPNAKNQLTQAARYLLSTLHVLGLHHPKCAEIAKSIWILTSIGLQNLVLDGSPDLPPYKEAVLGGCVNRCSPVLHVLHIA